MKTRNKTQGMGLQTHHEPTAQARLCGVLWGFAYAKKARKQHALGLLEPK